jgi:DNA-binding winged helix-turn-helix (wHTH) protein/Tol biopolymer transport system component
MGQTFPTPSSPNPIRADAADIHFGAFHVDLRSGEIRKGGLRIKLHAQPFAVLAMLLRRPNEVVTRQELQQELWAEDTFVDFEHGLNKAINKLRDALGDDAHDPRFVETLPGRGYRFIAPVLTPSGDASAEDPVVTSGTASQLNPSIGIEARAKSRSWPWVAAGLALSVLAAGAVLMAYRASRNTVVSPGNVQFTRLSDAGSVTAVAISPDGKYLAFAAVSGGRQTLSLRNLETKTDTPILPPGGPLQGLTFSPDGNYVYFVKPDDDGAQTSLYVVPTTGGALRKVLSGISSPIGFSPDGEQFAFERCQTPDQHELLVTKTNETGPPKSLAHLPPCSVAYQAGPSWSPDGRQLAMAMGSAIFTVDTKSGHVQPIYEMGSDLVGRPGWLGPNKIVFGGDRDKGSRQLLTMDTVTRARERLTNDVVDYGLVLETARHGKTVLTTISDPDFQVWRAPAQDLSGGNEITGGPIAAMTVLELPEGKLLTTALDGTPWLVEQDGRNREAFGAVRQVPLGVPPRGCGDGLLITSLERSGLAALNVVKGDGSEVVKRITAAILLGACSKDGKTVYFVKSEFPRTLWRVGLEDRDPTKVLEVPAGNELICPLEVSTDGKLIAYGVTREPRNWTAPITVVAQSLKENAEVARVEIPGKTKVIRWSPDNSGFTYALEALESSGLWNQALTGTAPRKLASFNDSVYDFAWSVDGKSLLLVRGRWNSNIVLLQDSR